MKFSYTTCLIIGSLALGACSDGGGGSPVAPPVDLPPTVSSIDDTSVVANGPEQRIVFSVSDDVTPAVDLAVDAETDKPDLFAGEGISLAGSGEDRELVFTPATGVIGMASITLTVSDSAGQTAAVDFFVSITPQQAAFDTTLRSVFAADENDEPVTLNDKELSDNEATYDDLLRD